MIPKQVTIYTDGGCQPSNPGPGGYGAVLLHGEHRKELTSGYRWTTNNRMELMAAICALEALQKPCDVTLHSDSKYLVDAMNVGWAKRWQANNWKRNKRGDAAKNPDLWQRLLDAAALHDVTWVWVRGHSGVPENERCDQLAQQAARSPDLPVDSAYEAENSGPQG
jgi:ribonuclease HI